MEDDGFSDERHRLIRSGDGSCTAYSAEYDEHYHSTREGALRETLYKHVYPALERFKAAQTVRMLDICFGLGFNTFATLAAFRERGEKKRIEIVSPEMDEALVASLAHFEYPEAFAPLKPIIESVSRTGRFEDEMTRIDVLFGDARKILPTLTQPFDVVYQDAFSLKCNPALWTREYFAELARLTHDRSIITSYSTALQVRLALYENGFNVYLNKGEGFRNATVASKTELSQYEKVDMAHKMACNPDVKSLGDNELV